MTSAPRPIFIVGCHRSGTTLLRLMLDSHPNISCGPETRLLSDFARLTDERWQHLSLYGFPREYWNHKVAGFVDSFHTDYAQRRGKTRWADKTPHHGLVLKFITELFPTCQIIHVIRDGRDVVASHRDRWGYISALKAVEKWPYYIRAVRTVGEQLSSDRYYEVRYEELVTNTQATMRALLMFLEEPWDDAVLEYDQVPHDVAPRYATFTRTRREAANDQDSIYRSRVGAYKREADPLIQLLIRMRGGRTLRDLGYVTRRSSPRRRHDATGWRRETS